MGTVWRATDLLLGRIVAVKQLTPGALGRARDDLRTRAILEARALARVRHKAIVEIYDVIDADGDPWLVMEYIEGRSVTDTVAASGPQPVPAVARIGATVADALQAVHAARILHRDVKPANILLTERRQVFLVDFGIAAIQDERTSLTGPHTVVGTVGFIAPERLRHGEVGPPSDTWSLGVTLYYALTARLPFSGPDPDTDPKTTLLRVLSDDPDPLDGPLSALVTAMLAKDPRSRPTLAQAAAALRGTVSPGRSPRGQQPPRDQRPPRDQGSTRKQEPPPQQEPTRKHDPTRKHEPSDAELAASVAGRPPGEAARALTAAPRDQA
ncbi:MAG: protein kinase domain-containing protein, partial [Spirillospora sp.]